MSTYIIASEKKWNQELILLLKEKIPENWLLIDNKSEFTVNNIKKINPEYIFLPHWSYHIEEGIYNNYNCVVFHETDLPFGRGGSPIQNLIERGYEKTKISAIKAIKEFDAGPIYLKKDLSLLGTAEEIFIRANGIIADMIIEIINNKITPAEQQGAISTFKRRTPEQSNISNLDTIDNIYNYIRMLDAEGYPNAYIETKHFKFEFSRASLKSNKTIIADVRITKK